MFGVEGRGPKESEDPKDDDKGLIEGFLVLAWTFPLPPSPHEA